MGHQPSRIKAYTRAERQAEADLYALSKLLAAVPSNPEPDFTRSQVQEIMHYADHKAAAALLERLVALGCGERVTLGTHDRGPRKAGGTRGRGPNHSGVWRLWSNAEKEKYKMGVDAHFEGQKMGAETQIGQKMGVDAHLLGSCLFSKLNNNPKAMAMAEGEVKGLVREEHETPLTEAQKSFQGFLMSNPCALDPRGARTAARETPDEEVKILEAAGQAFWKGRVEELSAQATKARGNHRGLLVSKLKTPGDRRKLVEDARAHLVGTLAKGQVPTGTRGDAALLMVIKAWRERGAEIPTNPDSASYMAKHDRAEEAWSLVVEVFRNTHPDQMEAISQEMVAKGLPSEGGSVVQKRARRHFLRQALLPLIEGIELRNKDAA